MRNSELEKRIGDSDTHFTNALATLAIIQNNFTGQSDPLNDEIMFYSIEAARNEIKTAYKILTDGTFYGDYKGDYPIVV
jgi:hypothetical protein